MADYKITRELAKFFRVHLIPYRLEQRNFFIAGSVFTVNNGEITIYFPGYHTNLKSMVHQYQNPERFYKKLLSVLSTLKSRNHYAALPLFIELNNEVTY